MTSEAESTLGAVFDAVEPLTIGIEEEVFLVDPETLDLKPCAREVLARAPEDAILKLELPAAQLEIATAPGRTVAEVIAQLAAGRRALAAAAEGIAVPVAAAVHPFAAAEGELNPGEDYERLRDEYGFVAERQLVCALQIHVAVGGAARTLAVYNALRGYLPELAALAAAAPFYENRDTGMASIRPMIAQMLPRQGLPPSLDSWESFMDALGWGAVSGTVTEPGQWWFELRPHIAFGTLELRVPDVQPTVRDAAAVAAFCHALVGWLSERHDAGETLTTHDAWRIAENRWSAARYGLAGSLADLETGERAPTRELLQRRVEELAPVAERLGCAAELRDAARLAGEGAAERLRALGLRESVVWLARNFTA